MKKRLLLLFFLAVSTGSSLAQPSDDIQMNRIMDELRQFDANLDPDIYDALYPDEPVMLIHGRVTQPGKAATLQELRSERERHEYDYQMADISKPFISVSKDGSMAWTVVHQRRKEIDRDSGATVRTWDMSVLRVFEKMPDGQWKIVTQANSMVD